MAEKVAVIGAGPCGLTACKNLLEAGFEVEVLERCQELGGLWNYASPSGGVYQSTHLISSKRMIEYTDFPMPEDYPPYPHHSLVLEYLRSYAAAFSLEDHIRYGAEVSSIEEKEGGWEVELSGGERRSYRALFIANGHLWDPLIPEIPGEFSGEVLHSAQYREPGIFAGKRVLVVGAGNSGCDIAVEAARHASVSFHSMRRGYHFIPKFIGGKPADEVGELMLKLRVPAFIRRAIGRAMIHLINGPATRYGLPKPDHALFESHPIINSQLLYHLGHGDIAPRPDVERFDGKQVRFADGRVETVDLIVFATGYKVSFPFADPSILDASSGAPELYLHLFHQRRDDLFVVGMIQADSGLFGIADRQARLAARYLRGLDARAPAALKLRQRIREGRWTAGRDIKTIGTRRHVLEVEHFAYTRELERLCKRLPAPELAGASSPAPKRDEAVEAGVG